MASGGVHLLTGFGLGLLAPSAPAAFVSGVGSHAALDVLPHRDYQTWTANAIDVGAACAIAVVLGRGLARRDRLRGFAGALGAIVPDVEVVSFRAGLISEREKRFPTHTGTLPHGRGGSVSAIVVSAAAVGSAVLSARRARARANRLRDQGDRSPEGAERWRSARVRSTNATAASSGM